MSVLFFHLPYCLPAGRPSGSGVRPSAMLDAFRANGLEVIAIHGDSAKRAQLIDRHRGRLAEPDVVGVYAESSTMPMGLTDSDHWPRRPGLDAAFFGSARAVGVPVGMFYRDVHWRFPRYRKRVPFAKRLIARAFYQLELWQLSRTLDVLFVPTSELMRHLPELHGRVEALPLPPGATLTDTAEPAADAPLTLLYVGGVAADTYDVRPMLDVFRRVPRARLHLCCREPEWQRFLRETGVAIPPNVTVHHVSGAALAVLYQAADAVCDLRRVDEYLRVSMPVKLFEALGHGRPVIALKGTSQADFIVREDVGWVFDSVAEAADAIEHWCDDRTPLATGRARAREVRTRHSWRDRAAEAVAALQRAAR